MNQQLSAFAHTIKRHAAGVVKLLNEHLIKPCLFSSSVPSLNKSLSLEHTINTTFGSIEIKLILIDKRIATDSRDKYVSSQQIEIVYLPRVQHFEFEFDSKTYKNYQKKKMNLLMRCMVFIMMAFFWERWWTRPTYIKLYAGSMVVNDISAHVLEKYFHFKNFGFSIKEILLREQDCKSLVSELEKSNLLDNSLYKNHSSKTNLLDWLNEGNMFAPRYQHLCNVFANIFQRKPVFNEIIKREYLFGEGNFTHEREMSKDLMDDAYKTLVHIFTQSPLSHCKKCFSQRIKDLRLQIKCLSLEQRGFYHQYLAGRLTQNHFDGSSEDAGKFIFPFDWYFRYKELKSTFI